MLEIRKFTVSTEDVGNTERKAVVQGKTSGFWRESIGKNFWRESIIYTEKFPARSKYLNPSPHSPCHTNNPTKANKQTTNTKTKRRGITKLKPAGVVQYLQTAKRQTTDNMAQATPLFTIDTLSVYRGFNSFLLQPAPSHPGK